MSQPVAMPLRQVIFRRMRLREPAAAVARDLGLNERTVQNLMHRFRERGEAGIGPDYRAPAPPAHAFPAAVREAALALRREHPTWGSGLIRVMLAEARPDGPTPSERTIRDWLRAAGLGPAPKPRGAGPGPRPPGRAAAPHDCWQVDAAEKIPLADGRLVSWLRIVDECSGAVLATAVFPPGELVAGRSPRDA